jgi:hypothetical protein
MANDWFMFQGLAGSFTGTSCIFFVQVAFVGRSPAEGGASLAARDSFTGTARHRRFVPGLRLPKGRFAPISRKHHDASRIRTSH